MKKNFYITAICIILLVSSGSYLYGGQTTGLTDESMKIGCLADLTGPSSFLGRGANVGAMSYFKYINDEGGINGRKIIYIAEDNKYQPATAVAGLKKLVYRDKIFATCFSWGTVCALATAKDVKKEKIPTLFFGMGEEIFTPFRRYMFTYQTTYYREAFTIADYIVNNLKAKDMRFACMHQDGSVGRGGSKGFKEAAKLYGAKWVGETHHKRGALDFTSEVLKLKKAGANFVFLATVTREAAGVLREADKLDWHPQFFGATGCIDEKVLELAGKSAEGYSGAIDVVSWHEDTPGMKKVKKAVLKYHGTFEEMSALTTNAWVGAMLFSEGLKRAGRGITRDGLVDALETIKNFDPDGLMPPVTWGPNRREGQIGSRIVKADLEKKMLVPVTKWTIPEY